MQNYFALGNLLTYTHAIMPNIRAIGKVLGAGLLISTVIPAQILVAGPVFKNTETLPHFFWKSLRRILGISVEFNREARVDNKPMIYMSNHISVLDPIILASVSRKSGFVAMKELEEWPLIGVFARNIGTVFASNNKSTHDIPDIHRQLNDQINKGRNVTFCPEGIVSEGKRVAPFRTGIIKLAFDNKSTVNRLEKNIGFQPLALTFTAVNGQDPETDPALYRKFIIDRKQDVWAQLWDMLSVKSLKAKITALPELDPKDFKTARELADKSREMIIEAL